MKKISAVYKVTNTVSGEFYVGSSKDVEMRWKSHKRPSSWKQQPNNRMYQEMKRLGTDVFTFEILAEFPPEHLRRKEQEAIETLHPTYNNNDAYVSEDSKLLKQKTNSKAYYEAHKDKLKANRKAYREAHKEEEKAREKAYREAHKGERKSYWKAYHEAHKEERKAYYEAHKEEQKAYYEAHKEERKAFMKAYREAHKNT